MEQDIKQLVVGGMPNEDAVREVSALELIKVTFKEGNGMPYNPVCNPAPSGSNYCGPSGSPCWPSGGCTPDNCSPICSPNYPREQ